MKQMINKITNDELLPSSQVSTNPMLAAVFLFLDDIREPKHAFEYTKQKMFLKKRKL